MHQAIIISSNYSSLAGDREYIVINPQAKKTVYGTSWSDRDDKKVLSVISSV
tara:strand:- start:196 stop:351 length:156 start_codon:yes stop_codon:yes gene_type:complete